MTELTKYNISEILKERGYTGMSSGQITSFRKNGKFLIWTNHERLNGALIHHGDKPIKTLEELIEIETENL